MVHVTETHRVLAKMFTENTGRHFLDSGDHYGRNYDRNAGLTAEAIAEGDVATFDVWPNRDYPEGRQGELGVTLWAPAWCAEVFTYNAELDAEFRTWVAANDPENERYWPDLCEDFATNERAGAGIYGDASGPFTENTYNRECALSQTLQFTYWEDDDGGHALLQVHGGCDVRGGYTAPRAFDCSAEGDPIGVFDFARFSVYAEDDAPTSGQCELEGMPVRMSTAHGWDTTYDGYLLQPYDGRGYMDSRAFRDAEGVWQFPADTRADILPVNDYDVVESDDDTLRGVFRVVKDDAGTWRVFSPINGAECHAAPY